VKYQNREYINGFSIRFEPIHSFDSNLIRNLINDFLDENGIELEFYRIHYLSDTETIDWVSDENC
jgi:hypothetical protein